MLKLSNLTNQLEHNHFAPTSTNWFNYPINNRITTLYILKQTCLINQWEHNHSVCKSTSLSIHPSNESISVLCTVKQTGVRFWSQYYHSKVFNQ